MAWWFDAGDVDDSHRMILVRFSDGSFNAGPADLYSIYNLMPGDPGDTSWWDDEIVTAMHRHPDWMGGDGLRWAYDPTA